MTPATIIRSNGSKWAGEEPDDIATLLSVLEREPLDYTFEQYGNFIQHPIKWLGPDNEIAQAVGPDATGFFGNFETVSHVFNIYTNDQEIVEKLSRAIRANQRRADYGPRCACGTKLAKRERMEYIEIKRTLWADSPAPVCAKCRKDSP